MAVKKHIGRRLLALLCLLAVLTLLLQAAIGRCMRAAYPDGYRELVMSAAAQYDLPPSLLFAVIRTESGFSPEAVSSAGATGLMQITDSTWEWAQYRCKDDPLLTAGALTQPEVNVHVGACVLKLLSEQFSNGDTVLAAYNAGMGHVSDWLADERYSDDGVTLREIPFGETAQYVGKVRRAQEVYQKLYHIK